MGSVVGDFKELRSYWDFDKNTLGIDDIGINSRKVVYWKCPKCGHAWEEKINVVQMRKTICKVCNARNGGNGSLLKGFNDLATLRPDLVEDWDFELNTVKPTEVQLGSKYRIHWVCHECGHKWVNRLDTRTKNGCGCPVCARTKAHGSSVADYTIYKLLVDVYGSDKVHYRYRLLGLEIDVFLPDLKLCIEYDGYAWHSKEDKVVIDDVKTKVLQSNGYKVYRIKERDDRICKVDFKGDFTAYVPVVREDYYDEIKELYVEILSKWDILEKEMVSENYWNLSRLRVKSIIARPDKKSSFKYFLDNSGYDKLFWDYDKNEVKPEDIYSRGNDSVWMKCKYGHSVYIKASSIVRADYGCKYCSRIELKEGFNDVRISNYNYYIGFPSLRGLLSLNGMKNMDSSTVRYVCPLCGSMQNIPVYKIPFSEKRGGLVNCCCFEESIEVIVLGIFEEKIFYSVIIKGVYFLVLAYINKLDFILKRCDLDIKRLYDLPEDFVCLGAPTVFTVVMNSCYSLPVSESSISGITCRLSKEYSVKAIHSLIKQRDLVDSGKELGLLKNKGGFIKEIILSRVVEDLFFDLRSKGYYVIYDNKCSLKVPNILINVSSYVYYTNNEDRLDYLLRNNKEGKFLILSSLEREGVIYIPKYMLEIDYKSFINGLFMNIVDFFKLKTIKHYLSDMKYILTPFILCVNRIFPIPPKKCCIEDTGDGIKFSLSGVISIYFDYGCNIVGVSQVYLVKRYLSENYKLVLQDEMFRLLERLTEVCSSDLIGKINFYNDISYLRNIKISLLSNGEKFISVRYEEYSNFNDLI